MIKSSFRSWDPLPHWYNSPGDNYQRRISGYLPPGNFTIWGSHNLFLSSSEVKAALNFQWDWHVPNKKTFSKSLLQPILTFPSFPALEQAVLWLAVMGSLKFYDLIFDTDCSFPRTSTLFHNITFYNTFKPDKARLPNRDKKWFPYNS